MTLGLQENRTRRRRQRRWALIKWLLVLAALGAAGAFAYETGSQLARLEVTRLEEELAEVRSELGRSEEAQSRLRERLERTEGELENWQARYRAEVPSGEPARLLELLRQRLEAGVPAERLAFVISNAKEVRECDAGPVTRRFIVQTPLSTGASDAVAFADNTIVVTGTGQSAQDARGRPEAWFDPDAPVTVRFTVPGGESSEVTGTLPLHHSVVRADTEHRFSIVRSRRAFVEVTWERCAYP